MELEKAMAAVDHAAHQDDRWMFVALLVVGLVTIYFLARYLEMHGPCLDRANFGPISGGRRA